MGSCNHWDNWRRTRTRSVFFKADVDGIKTDPLFLHLECRAEAYAYSAWTPSSFLSAPLKERVIEQSKSRISLHPESQIPYNFHQQSTALYITTFKNAGRQESKRRADRIFRINSSRHLGEKSGWHSPIGQRPWCHSNSYPKFRPQGSSQYSIVAEARHLGYDMHV